MLNGEVREIFKTRSKVISYIRRFLDNLDFIEVAFSYFSAENFGDVYIKNRLPFWRFLPTCSSS